MNFNAQQFSQLYPLINVNHTYVEGSTVAFQITTAPPNQGCNNYPTDMHVMFYGL